MRGQEHGRAGFLALLRAAAFDSLPISRRDGTKPHGETLALTAMCPVARRSSTLIRKAAASVNWAGLLVGSGKPT